MTDNLPAVTEGGGGITPAVSSELASISEIHRRDPRRYWKDRGLQDRRRNLIQQGLDGTAPPARPANLERKLELQALMGRRNSAYWRDPALQAEYLAIVRSELGQASEPSAAPIKPAAKSGSRDPDTAKTEKVETDKAVVTADDARATLPPALIASWEKAGGVEARLAETKANLQSIVSYVATHDKAAATELMTSFQALSLPLRTAIWDLLSLPPRSGASVKPVSAADVKRFTSTVSGAHMAKFWGAKATPLKIGIIRRAFEGIKATLSPDDWAAWTRWYDHLTDLEAVAVNAALTGSLPKVKQ